MFNTPKSNFCFQAGCCVLSQHIYTSLDKFACFFTQITVLCIYCTFSVFSCSEILEEDFRKRLLISVWNKRDDGTSDFLGCTSFGIRHLENKHKVQRSFLSLLLGHSPPLSSFFSFVVRRSTIPPTNAWRLNLRQGLTTPHVHLYNIADQVLPFQIQTGPLIPNN